MKRIILIWVILLSAVFDVSAQKIINADELKKFYTEYLSVLEAEGTRVDSLVAAYCTKELYAAWNRDVNEIGLYDPFTNGYYDPVMTQNTLAIKKEGDSYVVSFNYLTWPDSKTMCESVIIYVNADGKISHTKRASDGMIIPSE